jgi:mannosyltransferase OCH1-like enzyme
MSAIPKIIHYVWVGGKPLSPLAEQCLASWKTYLPDYEIKRWDETNSHMQHPYVQAMYTTKKWAFVSDYIRFAALRDEGGVYLDTDLELFKDITPLLEQPVGFVGRSKSGQIESSIIGALPHAAFVDAALHFYDTDTKHSIADTSPLVLERAIAATPADVVTMFDYTYFHPIDEGEYVTPVIRQQSYGVHHWAESWVPYAKLRKVARRLGVMSALKSIKKLL